MTYLPHTACLLGDSWIIYALAAGHGLTVYAYIAIPIIYLKCAKKYKSTQHAMVRPIYKWLPAFVFCCALTHTLAIMTLFWGGFWYYFATALVILTGIVSAYTAFFVIPILPKYLADRENQQETIEKLVNQLKAHSSMKEDWTELSTTLAKLDTMGSA